jgi:Ran-binding protein 9/10
MAARPTPAPSNRTSSVSIPLPLPSLEDIMSSVSSTSARAPVSHQPSGSLPSGLTLSHSPTFPRVIRANNASGSPPTPSTSAPRADIACFPPLSASPTRTRRFGGGPLDLRPPSLHHRGTHAHATLSSPHLALHQPPPPFPRPSYLEHSSLRHLLQTELPPNLPPSRYTQSTIYPCAPRHQHSSVTPALIDDSDAESTTASPPPGLPASPPASATTKSPNETITLVGSSPVFRLPTRWSEQDRHPYLSVSADGRELTYNGLFLFFLTNLVSFCPIRGKLPEYGVRHFFSCPPLTLSRWRSKRQRRYGPHESSHTPSLWHLLLRNRNFEQSAESVSSSLLIIRSLLSMIHSVT